MRNFTKFAVVALVCIGSTQSFAQTEKRPFGARHTRQEIIFPKVNGLTVYKTDLHTHTIYSDGEVTPAFRVHEAWRDGLDAVAITDHIEYRRIERDMYKFMQPYIKDELRGKKYAINTNVMTVAPDENGLLVDFNVPYETARKKGDELGILVIRGVEITRKNLGDYNALFTKDNNSIYDPDAVQAIRNARAQGAFIIHNHPQFDRKNENKLTDFCNSLYAEGLIDGVEVGNSCYFYRWIIDHVLNGKYTPCADTDVHSTTDIDYKSGRRDNTVRYRNMTLVFAKSCDEESLHKALLDGRTVAYHDNMLVGSEKLLTDLFKASVKFEVAGKSGKKLSVAVTNNSSMPYIIKAERTVHHIEPLGTTMISVNEESGKVNVSVENMWCGSNCHPTMEMRLK